MNKSSHRALYILLLQDCGGTVSCLPNKHHLLPCSFGPSLHSDSVCSPRRWIIIGPNPLYHVFILSQPLLQAKVAMSPKFWLMDSRGGLLEGGSFLWRFLFLVIKGERHTREFLMSWLSQLPQDQWYLELCPFDDEGVCGNWKDVDPATWHCPNAETTMSRPSGVWDNQTPSVT